MRQIKGVLRQSRLTPVFDESNVSKGKERGRGFHRGGTATHQPYLWQR
jgi:hypothetical protein